MKSVPLTRDETNAFDRTDAVLERSWAERLLRFAEGSHFRACAILLVVGLFCFLPGIASLQPVDREEPRFAQAAKQMLETGDFVAIRLQDEPQHTNPPGIYWLQSASVAAAEALGLNAARTTIAVYRVPSLLGALAAILLTYWAALALASRREAFLAAAFLAASLLLMVEARLAKPDAVLLACIIAGMGGLARAYLARGAARLPLPTVVLFWLATGVGMLVAGPVVLFFPGSAALTLAVRERSLRWLSVLRPALGFAIVLVICAPWAAAIAWRTGFDFFTAGGSEALTKLLAVEHYRWTPPGAYLLLFFLTFWPTAVFAAIAAPFVWINRRADVVFFLLAWTLPAWILLEFVPTKMPQYVMPLYPALAILTALALTRGFVGPHRVFARPASLLVVLVPIGLAITLPLAAQHFGDRLAIIGMPLVFVSVMVALFAWYLFLRRAAIAAALMGVAAAMVLSAGVFGFFQPLLRSLQISDRLVETVEAIDCPASRIATLGYREPSLVFLVGTQLSILDSGAEAVAFLSGEGCRVALVERRRQSEFLAALDGDAVAPALLTRVSGFNASEGQRVDVGVYVVRE
jgi:4-amino-4-deoxy-L-arabinose transferase-like glycosyltransferase